jgi:N-acetyl-anhydromuramyl-L-alanine amidase AmpD
MEGPKTDPSGTPTTWNANGPVARRAGPAGTSDQTRATPGSAARLEPFIAGAGATELFYPEKADRPWRYIVLHHSASAAGNYDEIDREHRKLLGYEGCGYHFVIGNGNGSGDGQIEVAQRWNRQKQGVHCRNARTHDVDEYGIGICLVGDLDQQPPTPRQVAATRALVEYLSGRYRIEPARVTTHAHLAATPTVCPGKYFPATILAGANAEAQGGAEE